MSNILNNIQEIISDSNGYSKIVDFIKVPCKPLINLPGLTFLSPKALEELKQSERTDELLPGDEVEIHLFYAKHLYKAGLCKIRFPSFYKSARALFNESTANTIGNLAPFYFELGYELCELIPEDQWPVEDLLSLLKKAEYNRRHYLIKRWNTTDNTFLMGVTHDEKRLLNVLSSMNSNVLPLNINSQNLSNFYELDE